MANYYMIGGDGKEYGPVSGEQLRQWLAEGRANAQTQVRAEGGAYLALGSVPELNAPAAAATPPPAPAATDYFMRGGDGKEYGPVSIAQLRQWTGEGRANAQTLVRAANGGAYVALGTIPEFFGAAAPRPAAASLPLAHALAQSSTLSGGVDEQAQVKRLAGIITSGAGWIKCMAVLLFISGGFEVLSLWGIVIAWLPIWLGVTLWTATTRAQNAELLGSEAELAAALEKLRFYFKLSVIFMILLLVVGVIFIFIGLAMGLSGLASMRNGNMNF